MSIAQHIVDAQTTRQVWYGISMGAPGFIVPFLNLYYRRIGLSEPQIGILSAIKPWVAASCGALDNPTPPCCHTPTPTGNALCALADRFSIHMTMLMCCYIGVTALQTIMMLFSSFSAQLVLAIVSAAISSPWGVISDAAVMAAVPRVRLVVDVHAPVLTLLRIQCCLRHTPTAHHHYPSTARCVRRDEGVGERHVGRDIPHCRHSQHLPGPLSRLSHLCRRLCRRDHPRLNAPHRCAEATS